MAPARPRFVKLPRSSFRCNQMDPVELAVFSSRMEALCEEMGATLRRSAFSPNIRDRLDFSCAIFDREGRLVAQAAHIPVHLGSMAYAMQDLVDQFDWSDGDAVLLNDPFLGGTHLPDITVVTPCFLDGELQGFAVNRAHHADVGAESPGSMPTSRRLEEEGLILPPQRICQGGRLDESRIEAIVSATRAPRDMRGDLLAQVHVNDRGCARLREQVEEMGTEAYARALNALNDYGRTIARNALKAISDGIYEAAEMMEDDGLGHEDIRLQVRLQVQDGRVRVDFEGTDAQVEGPINCPISVTAAGVYYAFRCLMPAYTPACAGCFDAIELHAPEGCLLNAQSPAAVAAGNVETSMRVVDLILAALRQALPERIPAASQGTMNNFAVGQDGKASWAYYETLAGGMGAHAGGPGLSARHSHMTNTLNTPVEVMEQVYPMQVRRYALRRGSGGQGRHPGGEGVIREYEFRAPARFSLLAERRRRAPPGAAGGTDGQAGRNCLNGEDLPGKCQRSAAEGDRLVIETPGAGGWGSAA